MKVKSLINPVTMQSTQAEIRIVPGLFKGTYDSHIHPKESLIGYTKRWNYKPTIPMVLEDFYFHNDTYTVVR